MDYYLIVAMNCVVFCYREIDHRSKSNAIKWRPLSTNLIKKIISLDIFVN